MDDFERELKIGFLDEAQQSVSDVEQCFLSLEQDPSNEDNLNKIFRLAHNLKGSSKAVGFSAFGEFTHEFETFILKIKNKELAATPKVVNLLLQANDFVLEMISKLKEDLDATFDFANLLEQMRTCTADEPQGEEEAQAEVPELEMSESTEVAAENTSDAIALPEIEIPTGFIPASKAPQPEEEDPFYLAQRLQDEADAAAAAAAAAPKKAPTLEVVKEVVKEVAKPAAEQPAAKKATTAMPDESIRVSLSKVEALINFVGEMVILQSVMREQAMATESLLLKKTVHMLGKVSKEIQETAMGLRMVPLKPTFQKMSRIVSDTSMALGKNIQLNLTGEDTEIDKTILEKLNDPLVHLIRNSVDHGIESADIRKNSGKSEVGHVELKAYHQSGKLIIDVVDDGGGLNPEKLINKAIEKGLLKPGTQLSEKEAYKLIFAPGFSTKEQVSDVSGRGVGMDVVRTNLQELGGEIFIESAIGKGTTFKIVLPLTLAIIDAMVVTYSNEKFVLPLGHVHETVSTKDHTVQNITGCGDVILLRGESIRMIRLGDFFGIKSHKKVEDLITIIIRTGPEPFAILVDDILGQYQVVTKQLGEELQDIKGVSGSTILGDGKPALILEPSDLLKRKVNSSYEAPKAVHGGHAA